MEMGHCFADLSPRVQIETGHYFAFFGRVVPQNHRKKPRPQSAGPSDLSDPQTLGESDLQTLRPSSEPEGRIMMGSRRDPRKSRHSAGHPRHVNPMHIKLMHINQMNCFPDSLFAHVVIVTVRLHKSNVCRTALALERSIVL